ncbi:MAG: hypothetical protein SVM80_03720 [Halobacteriota archaeon]|nr:hypothetical protein [Halobacteriota archaeon]
MKTLHKKIVGTFFVVLMILSAVGTAVAEPMRGVVQPERKNAQLLGEDTIDEKKIVGSGTLYAEGRGKALLEGTGWASLCGVGQMIVIGKDVTVYTDGQGKVTHIGELITIYRGRGVARVVGEDMVVLIRAKGKLAASGEGMAILRGTGDFEVGNWRTWTNTVQPYEVDGIKLAMVE